MSFRLCERVAVARLPGLGINDRWVLGVLCSRADDRGRGAILNVRRMARAEGVDHAILHRSLRKLERAGYIAKNVQRRGRGVAVYSVMVRALPKVHNERGGDPTVTPGGDSAVTPTGDPTVTPKGSCTGIQYKNPPITPPTTDSGTTRSAPPGQRAIDEGAPTILAEVVEGMARKPNERTRASWLAKLRTRLADSGKSLKAVTIRGQEIREAYAALRASAWHQERGIAHLGHLLAKASRVDDMLRRGDAKASPPPKPGPGTGGKQIGWNTNAPGWT